MDTHVPLLFVFGSPEAVPAWETRSHGPNAPCHVCRPDWVCIILRYQSYSSQTTTYKPVTVTAAVPVAVAVVVVVAVAVVVL